MSALAASAAACTECGSQHLQHDDSHAELVCSDCGLVLAADLPDPGPEWRARDPLREQSRARTGPPIRASLPDRGLTTDMGHADVAAHNRPLYDRLRRWQRRERKHGTGRRMAVARREIEALARNLALPPRLRETAAFIFRQTGREPELAGRPLRALAAASLYVACRQAQVPRTLTEISRHGRYDRREVQRSYQALARVFGLELSPPVPETYLPRLCSRLGVSPRVAVMARQLLKATRERPVSGAAPHSLAAATVYLASIIAGERRLQKQVARAAGLSEVTIRARYRDIVRHLTLEVRVAPRREGPEGA